MQKKPGKVCPSHKELVTVPVGGGPAITEFVALAVDAPPTGQVQAPEQPLALPITPDELVARVRTAEDAGHSLANAYEIVAAALHLSSCVVSDCYAEHADGCHFLHE